MPLAIDRHPAPPPPLQPTPESPLKHTLTIGAKITLVAIGPVVLTLAATLITLLVQQRRLGREFDEATRQQAATEVAKTARSAYLVCEVTEVRNQKRLRQDLSTARARLEASGGFRLGSDRTRWEAVDQGGGRREAVELPKAMVGQRWLGHVREAKETALLVDEVTELTGAFCTLFQRINDAGDMLRVATSVVRSDGTRAVGTVVSALNADGSRNAVVETVLNGQTYQGRAYVVDQWHSTSYEPLWDASHQRVIGMLYIGLGMKSVNQELQNCLAQMNAGRTGTVSVLGATGDERGHWIVGAGPDAGRTEAWNEVDADGAPYVRQLVEKAVVTPPGKVAQLSHRRVAKSGGKPRLEHEAVTYFAPWNWVIVASAPQDDFAEGRNRLTATGDSVVLAVVAVAIVVALLAAVCGVLLGRTVTRPIARVVSTLNANSSEIAATATQVATASQTQADGATQQASALEESSASLEQMAGMTKRNAEAANQAKSIAAEARSAAEAGVVDMRAMDSAMDDIQASSGEVQKIIKTIDEIAFQTNILALNAAVEAARAGSSGLGFAVVADEVRSLAQRSAAAARETAAKIETAIGKTQQGVQLSHRVGETLTMIVGKVREVDTLVADVATASREQSVGVGQITTAVSEMDRTVQSNAASADESAAAARTLNAQAQSLNKAVVALGDLVGQSATAPSDTPTEPTTSTRQLIVWDAGRMSTGVASVDEQHRELIDMINRLHVALLDQQGRAEQEQMISFLSDYVQRHFKHEETLMDEHHCSSAGANRAAHQKFLRDFTSLTAAFKSGEPNSALLLDLRRLVGDWLTNHICQIDTKLRGCTSHDHCVRAKLIQSGKAAALAHA